MRSWLVGGTALLALLLAAAPVLAAQGTLQGHAAVPVRITGDHDASASDAQFLVAGDDGQVTLMLQGAEGKATRVVQRAYGIVNSQDPKAEVLWSQSVEKVPLDLHGAILTLESREPQFQALAYDAQADLAGLASQPLQVGLGAKDVHVTETLQRPLSVQLVSDSDPFAHTVPAGLYQASAENGRLALDGHFRMFLSGATLAWNSPGAEPQHFQAFFHTEDRDGTLYNPIDGSWTGGGKHMEYIQEYLLIDASSGHVDMHFAGLPASLFAARSTVAVTGQATIPRMDGTVTVTEEEKATTHTLHSQDLTLAGRFTLLAHDADASGTGTRIDGSGDLTTVSYGAVDAHYDWATAAVAVGLGAAVLAAFAWAAVNGKALLGSLGAIAGYARVHGGEVLEHPGRAEVYERVKAFPGVNFVQLSQQVEFGASTLNYHIRVLEKNGYITSVRDGRYLRFFDRTSGSYSGNRKMAVSALRNETSAAMAKHIRDNPGVAQCDLATKFSVTPSTVTWHINRLRGQGLVQKAREGAHTRYYLGEGWASLPLEEQARQAPVAVVA